MPTRRPAEDRPRPEGPPHAGSVHLRCTGWVNAPFPAESQTANRTHLIPLASNGTRNLWLLNGRISFILMTCRSTVFPSLHTSSANSGGNVHSASAEYVRFAPEPSMAQLRNRTSPLET